MITELYRTQLYRTRVCKNRSKKSSSASHVHPARARAPRQSTAQPAHELANDSAAILAQALVAGHLKL